MQLFNLSCSSTLAERRRRLLSVQALEQHILLRILPVRWWLVCPSLRDELVSLQSRVKTFGVPRHRHKPKIYQNNRCYVERMGPLCLNLSQFTHKSPLETTFGYIYACHVHYHPCGLPNSDPESNASP